MKDINLWFQSIFNDLQTNNKKIVLVAGASSSGKTVSTNKLQEYLQDKGYNTLKFSADEYYKGISRTITSKTIKHPRFTKYLPKLENIAIIVRETIEFDSFDEKFNDDNISYLTSTLPEYLEIEDVEPFIDSLKFYCEHFNFDEPDAVDLEQLVYDINCLTNNESIILPNYSFKTSETTYSEENRKYGSDYEYIIIEGLYVLREEVLNNIDKDNVITACIYCSPETMLDRRYHRDIVEGRVSNTPETTIKSMLGVVMPGYYQYVHPTLKNATHIFTSLFTENEIKKRQIDTTYNFQLNPNKTQKLTPGQIRLISKRKENRVFYNNHELSTELCFEENQAKSLKFRIFDINGVPHIECFDLSTMLSTKNKQETFVRKLFNMAKFTTTKEVCLNIKKYCMVTPYGEIVFDLYSNEGKIVVEVDTDNKYSLNYLREILGLTQILPLDRQFNHSNSKLSEK